MTVNKPNKQADARAKEQVDPSASPDRKTLL